MLIQANNLIGMPIASLEEEKKIGEVTNIIVEISSNNIAKVLGFLVKNKKSIFSHDLFLSQIDILDIDIQGISANSEKSLINPAEIIRAQKILQRKFNLIGLTAIDKFGKKIGKVYSFAIENKTFQVTKYYVKSFFEERIFDAENVIKIDERKIIFANKEKSQKNQIKEPRYAIKKFFTKSY